MSGRPTRTVDPLAVAGLADLLGADDVDTSVGAPLPALWHWAALARWVPLSALGPDGHAVDDGLPTHRDLPRRMFAGGEVAVLRPLRIGAEVGIERVVEDVRDTQGRSGPLRFVTVRDTVHDDQGPAVQERLDLVYRAGAGAAAPSPPSVGVPTSPDDGPAGLSSADRASWGFRADAPLLARFSALTCNSHRIHYDHPYATGTEGYAGLVVHGPLLALALAEVARRRGGPLRRVAHRGRSALLAGQRAHLDVVDPGADPGQGCTVEARRPGPTDDPDHADELVSTVTAHHHLEETS
ncbi:MaoC family dehydratase N-terminal domain-containing protein [Aeromicrobium sp. 50.2.37]|uniref:FAS1-like dehydratase domain-containing protein n=1 Tax=Aeromicrobium sp. 50.2.37 TaxID=2969305 RepID=UPI0021505290|nr:MaoC family dehydratase N-terminal domain-containing protein [Aeromicrobium sp. 50.2.37]MCR4514015.1 MaoC family dehydratase N-terminal domain-containing protein [Aeromicrobium sp. 50.2.37]